VPLMLSYVASNAALLNRRRSEISALTATLEDRRKVLEVERKKFQVRSQCRKEMMQADEGTCAGYRDGVPDLMTLGRVMACIEHRKAHCTGPASLHSTHFVCAEYQCLT
jgi:hypothetical protein